MQVIDDRRDAMSHGIKVAAGQADSAVDHRRDRSP